MQNNYLTIRKKNALAGKYVKNMQNMQNNMQNMFFQELELEFILVEICKK
jgi:hypothetical protein